MRSLPLLFLLAGASPAAAVTLVPGELIVADDQAAGGTLFAVDPANGAQTPIVSGYPFGAVATAPDGTIWAGAGNQIGRVDPEAGTFTPVAAGTVVQNAWGMTVGRSGAVFVADQFAINSCGNGGNISQVDAGSGAETIVFCLHAHPTDVVAEASDSLLIVSSVFGLVRLDPVTGASSGGFQGYRIFVAKSAFFQPRAVAARADGDLVCTSYAGSDPLAKAVLVVDPVTGNWDYLSRGGNLVDPQGVAVAADGSYLVADDQALPDGSGGVGAIVKVDPVSGTQTVISSAGAFRHPLRVAVYRVRNGVVPALSATWGSVKDRYR